MEEERKLIPVSHFIKKGMRAGYNQLREMHGEPIGFTQNMREYILTSAVAKELCEWSSQTGYSHLIDVERNELDFIQSAFPPIIEIDQDPSNIFSGGPDLIYVDRTGIGAVRTSRGFIDIVIMEKRNSRISKYLLSKVGIEIKAIDQSDPLILSDIFRLCAIMDQDHPNSENSMETSFMSFVEFMHKPKDQLMANQSMLDKFKQETKIKWESKCLIFAKSTLQVSIDTFDIHELTSEHFERSSMPDLTSDEVEDNTGLVLGVLISIKREHTLEMYA